MDGVELHYHHDVDVLIALSDSNLQDFTARVMQHVERSLLHSRDEVYFHGKGSCPYSTEQSHRRPIGKPVSAESY